MATYYQTDTNENFSHQQFTHLTHKHIHNAKEQAQGALKAHIFFHTSFFFLLLFESLLLTCIACTNPFSTYCAVMVSIEFLTFFSYFLLAHFFSERTQEQFTEIERTFIQKCQRAIPVDTSLQERHLALANSLFHLSSTLDKRVFFTLRVFPFSFDHPFFIRVVFALAIRNVLRWQQKLLHIAINEHVAFLQIEPLSIEAHTSLAHTYIALCKLCKKPQDTFFCGHWLTEQIYAKESIKLKHIKATELAIEELNILTDLEREDPWIYVQLAFCYNALELPEKEIQAYEKLCALRTEDKGALFNLGKLYFQNERTADGLRTYQRLCGVDAKTASQLLKYYTKSPGMNF